MITQIYPDDAYYGLPCSYVAIGCAGGRAGSIPTRSDGYATLQDVNKAIRGALKVKNYTYFPRDKRVTLQEYMGNRGTGRAVICVLGHYLYADFSQGKYWSFFNNSMDKIVAIWELY